MKSPIKSDESKPAQHKAWRIIRSFLGFILSGCLIVWILSLADWGRVLTAVQGANIPLILLTVALGYLALPLRAEQWRWLLARNPGADFIPTLKAVCLGHLGNCIFPLQGGELLRTFVLARDSRLSIPRVAGSVIVGRFQDFLPIAGLLLCTLLLLPVRDVSIAPSGNAAEFHVEASVLFTAVVVTACVFLVAAVLFVVFSFWQEKAADWLLRGVKRCMPSLHGRVASFLNEVMLGQLAGSHLKAFWAAQAYASACWMVYALASVPLFLAFGIEFQAALVSSLALTCLATTARFIPSAPGALGTFDAMALLAIAWANPDVSSDKALAIAITAHVVGIVSPALPGVVWLPFVWNDILKARRHADKELL